MDAPLLPCGASAALVVCALYACAVPGSEDREPAEPATELLSDSPGKPGEFASARARIEALRPGLPPARQRSTSHRAVVSLPRSAAEPIRVEDALSGVAVEVGLIAMPPRDVEADRDGDTALYAGAGPAGADVIVRMDAEGAEDFVAFARRPAREELVYRVDVTRVAGLRFVHGTLELLDVDGAPRLRMNPPDLVDASGARSRVGVRLDAACAHDTDPSAPWGREVTAPSSPVCDVTLDWADAAVTYPILVDPVWTTTGSMSGGRESHAATLLDDDRVLVAGGYGANASSEIYDPATGTWATTGGLVVGRPDLTMTLLPNGIVLAAGGASAAGPELYDPSTGTWSPAGTPAVTRNGHTATRLATGAVLVVGGTPGGLPPTAELYDFATDTWSATGGLAAPRGGHTAVLLPTGRVVVAGGTPIGAEQYDPSTGLWSPAGNLAAARWGHVGGALAGGKILVATGYQDKATAELYDPATAQWTAIPSLATGRHYATSCDLASGQVLVVGGVSNAQYAELATAERYLSGTNEWVGVDGMFLPRQDFTATLLADGRVLVAGGYNSIGGHVSLSSAEILELEPDGVACTSRIPCASGYCVDGVCCAEECAGPCVVCSAAMGATSDGVCSPASAGTDPDGDCADEGSSSCGNTGVCDGAGACVRYPPGTPCGALACSGGSSIAPACNMVGTCVQNVTSCDPYACADGVACGSSCVDDSECAGSGFCLSPGATCQLDQAAGAGCDAPSQCQSGFCVDGVCCDDACAGTCRACTAAAKGGGQDGVCGFVAGGADPGGDCPDDGASSCARDGQCDGAGGCRLYAGGTPCGATACVGNVQTGYACNGAAACLSDAQVDCGGYLCADGVCKISCADSGDCTPSDWCDGGVCAPRLDDGALCLGGEPCLSELCVDGVCCDAPCEGQCESCDVQGAQGTCVPSVGQPHGARPACALATPGAPCSGLACDGIERSSCAGLVGASVVCRPAACDAGIATDEETCDGEGSCPVEQPIACEPYACGGQACRTSCVTAADCADGASCAGGACVRGASCLDDQTAASPTGETIDCSPYRCENARCRTSCDSVLECREGYVCDADHRCDVPSTPSAFDAAGCSVGPRSSRGRSGGTDSGWMLAGAAVLAFGVRRRAAAARALLAAASFVAACVEVPDSSVGTGGGMADGRTAEASTAAQGRLEHLRGRYETAGAALGPGQIERLDEMPDGRLSPMLGQKATARVRRATIRLPRSAVGSVRVEDASSGIAVELRPRGAQDREVALVDGVALYVGGAAGGVDVLQRVHDEGVEDFSFFESRPPQEQLVYDVDMERVAGVRLVADVLELLDEAGAPRLRMAAPYVIDRAGAIFPAHVSTTCEHDRDPRAPWGRDIVPPGASRCEVRLDWAAAGVVYPAMVDPAWTTTGSMALKRNGHSASVLSTGIVLAAGREWPTSTACELYDPSTGTWAATGAMTTVRGKHPAVVLQNGKVLVAGGDAGTSAELYDPATGTWSATGSMADDRYDHVAVGLQDGRVLVAGGNSLSSAELYDPVAQTFSPAASMSVVRGEGPAASLLLDGRVLVTGGNLGGGVTAILASAELYDPVTDQWLPTGTMNMPREYHTSTVLPGGDVLVTGGYANIYLPFAELYDVATGAWSFTTSMAVGRCYHTASVLPGGELLVVGGETASANETPTVELFRPATQAWSVIPATPRTKQSATLLPTGKLLVAGGYNFANNFGGGLATAELFGFVGPGGGCALSIECLSGFCVEGVCCDAACDGPCEACSALRKGAGADGVCGLAALGMDSLGACVDAGASSCGPTGTCDGLGGCVLYPTGAGCAAPSCSGGSLTTSACNGLGACVEATGSCAPFACATDVACGASCATNAQCAPSAWCRTSDGTCQPDQLTGSSCASPLECSSGFCKDGVCCDSACAGTCRACSAAAKGAGADGVCGDVADGTDGSADCPDDGAPSCGRDGTCNGSGACRLYASGVPCAAPGCANNAPAESTCNGSGSCLTIATADCGEYLCEAGVCHASCTSDVECAQAAFCAAGVCEPRALNGQPCSASQECASGFCVDGLCCNGPCGGQCEACDVPGGEGKCVPAAGQPHGARPACAAGSTSDPCSEARCDGVERLSCAGFAGSAVPCREPSCVDGSMTLGEGCDGQGQCPPAKTKLCEPYQCGGDVCATSCAADTDCTAGSTCDPIIEKCIGLASCVDDHVLATPDGLRADCAPYACGAGACKTRCESVLDCARPNVCDSDHVCVSPAGTDLANGGCAVSPRGRPAGRGCAIAVAIALMMARRRRHARCLLAVC